MSDTYSHTEMITSVVYKYQRELYAFYLKNDIANMVYKHHIRKADVGFHSIIIAC